MNNHIVTMTGGIGSRFWLMSTPECSKQFINISGYGKTLLQLTAERFGDLCPQESMWIVTSERYKDIAQEQLPGISENNVLAESCLRSTASYIAYARWKIKKKHPDVNVVVTPSDQTVTDTTKFRRIIDKALSFVDKSSIIITLGIRPGRPETDYGYIAAGEPMARNKEIFHVEFFREKPNRGTTEKYLTAGNYSWNAEISVWNVGTITAVMRAHAPDIAQIFDRIYSDPYTKHEERTVKGLFPTAKSISIDHVVMERAEEVYVLPTEFGWFDSGTWEALQSLLPKDKEGNATVGTNARMYKSRNCMVHTSQKKRVVIQGLNDYIVAEKGNILPICQLSEGQRIKGFSKE